MEHVERQDEREAELKADVDELEKKGDELEERGEKLEGQIGETREEFERKQGTSEVPGLQEEARMTESHGGSEADPRPGTSESPGAADDEGQATGNPPNDDSPAADDEET